ncbi:hypothetical protein CJ030_MR1G000266 [Morella rubra]|uniref:Uncharacterized protein n=1 Tax=Morella rubra TaxID=262757 RepID=A0A6A1WQ89_9ROSI|nr:hypothetical protein CJ030_MR1G000266 [Morella rubra]
MMPYLLRIGQMRYLSQVAESDVNTVCFADDTGHLRYSGSDDNFCKVKPIFGEAYFRGHYLLRHVFVCTDCKGKFLCNSSLAIFCFCPPMTNAKEIDCSVVSMNLLLEANDYGAGASDDGADSPGADSVKALKLLRIKVIVICC